MLATIAPTASNYHETLQTLQYATRAKTIVTRAHANAFTEAVELRPPPSPVLEEIHETLIEVRHLPSSPALP